jgi:hypothetical protein
MAEKVNEEVTTDYLPKLLEGKSEQVGQAINAFAEHNEVFVEKMNREIFGIPTGKATEKGKGIVGLRYHIDDVYKREDFQGAEGVLRDLQIKRATSLERSTEVMDFWRTKTENKMIRGGASETELMNAANDSAYAIYAHEAANKFLTKSERQAMNIVNEYKNTAAKQGFARGLETSLKGFDKLTNFMKTNMLYFSLSWVKNNYFDNMAKAYVQNGLGGVFDTATLGKFKDGISEDVWNNLKNDISRTHKSSDMQDMMNHGVLDGPMFKSMTDEMTRDFLYAPKDIAKAMAPAEGLLETAGRGLDKFGQFYVANNPLIIGMNKIGSFMEATARATTYTNTLKALRSSAATKELGEDTLKEMAARVTRDTFFDYGDVSMLEKAVFKRIIPFYSFYSKNLPYWLGATFDPERAARVAHLGKIRGNIGREPTAEEKLGMTPYLVSGAPRMMGRDKHGNTEYLTMPSSSQYEAIRNLNPGEWIKQLQEKGHPIPKMVYELTTGKDLFAGGRLYPSENPQGKKYLYSRGFKYYAIQKGLEKLGIPVDSAIQNIAGTSGIKVDSKGNPTTSKDWTIVVDKISSTIFPHGFVDQIAGSVGKVAWNKEKWDEAILNRLLPAQTIKVSPDYERLVRARNIRSRSYERRRGGR